MEVTLYKIDFGTGKLVPADEGNGTKNELERGRILELNGYNCPRFAVLENLGVNPQFRAHGARYRTINLDAGGLCIKDAHDLEWLSAKKDNRIQTYITDEVLNEPDLLAAVEVAEAERDRLAEEKRAHEEAKERHRAELPSLYPHLKPGDKPAANIRKELKREFPGVKFNVRTERHGTVNVYWTDGPAGPRVKDVTDKYSKGSFNGMEDIYERDYDNVFCTVFGGADYIFTNRTISPDLIARVAESLGHPDVDLDDYTSDITRTVLREARDTDG